MNEILSDMGKRLYAFRKAKGLTQAQVAECLQISCNFYGDIERGTSRLSLEKFLLLYNKLGIDPTYLLTGKSIPQSELNDILSDVPKEKIDDLVKVMKIFCELCKKE